MNPFQEGVTDPLRKGFRVLLIDLLHRGVTEGVRRRIDRLAIEQTGNLGPPLKVWLGIVQPFQLVHDHPAQRRRGDAAEGQRHRHRDVRVLQQAVVLDERAEQHLLRVVVHDDVQPPHQAVASGAHRGGGPPSRIRSDPSRAPVGYARVVQ